MTTPVATDAATCKLHVDAHDQTVWVVDGEGLPRPTKQTVDEFLASENIFADTFRIVGLHKNAPLIVGLFHKKLRGEIASVQVVTPLVCPTHAERGNTEAVMHYMRRCVARAPSLGGFHEVEGHDYIVYAILKDMISNRKSPGEVDKERSMRMMQAHPLWKPLQFINNLNMWSCLGIIAYIVDPRWYIDVCNPDRIGKLQAYVGLDPKTQDGVSRPGRRQARYHELCSMVFDCWHQPDIRAAVSKNFADFGTKTVATTAPLGLRPGDFLWRVWSNRAGFNSARETNRVIADLRASQYFIAFIRHVWLSEIYRDSNAANAPLFRAKDFFRHAVEATEYEKHLLKD
jgi:hypothetical protein